MTSQQYSEAFKSKLVRKLTGPAAPSQGRLSQELGIPQGTLSRWVREAATMGAMADKKKPRSPNQWTTVEKLRLVVEATALKDEELGEFLRRAGVHEAQLKQWREAAEAGLAASTKTRNAAPEARQIKALSKELRRKDKALAEVTALLVLKKKVDALWGDEDDSTGGRTEK